MFCRDDWSSNLWLLPWSAAAWRAEDSHQPNTKLTLLLDRRRERSTARQAWKRYGKRESDLGGVHQTFSTRDVLWQNFVSQFHLSAISSLDFTSAGHTRHSSAVFKKPWISTLLIDGNAPASSACPMSSAKRHHYSPCTKEGLPLMLPVAFVAPQSQNDTRTASRTSSTKELPLDPSKVQNLSHGGCGFTCSQCFANFANCFTCSQGGCGLSLKWCNCVIPVRLFA